MTDKGQVQKWADPAMWLAPPMAEPGEIVRPKVYLVNMTPQPLLTIAAAAELYQGRIVTDVNEIDQEKALWWFEELSKTVLAAPFEFVTLHFLIDGVSRAFTHQLVRQRTAVYVQESMRFAVKEDAELAVSMPMELARLPEDDPRRVIWTDAVHDVAAAYNRLISGGVAAEDARGLLPTNIGTRVHYCTNLRNLAQHAGTRLCTQAQFEWRLVWAEMIKAIKQHPYQLPGNGYLDAWQYETICTLFKPVCFQTGKCGFDSAADRTCSIRPRVKKHEAAGDSPATWTDIQPVEWLADPRAARP